MLADDLLVPSNRAVGQVVEWLVWAAVVGNAERVTHVFLPLDDRGVDGIVRRVDDEAMCAVQVKGRAVLTHKGIEVVVNRNALDDPHVTFVMAYLDPSTVRLADAVYVMDADTVLTLGSHPRRAARPEVGLFLPYPPHPGTKSWPYSCALSELSTRLFPSAGVPTRAALPAPLPPVPVPPPEKKLLGHLAELEVMRLLGAPATLNTFKSFPDVEEVEYLVRHRPTGAIRGVQVKCMIVADAHTEGEIAFSGPAFVASPNVDFVILAWRRDHNAFDDNAWLIPAIDVPHLTRTDIPTAHIELRVAIGKGSRFDRYRVPRSRVAATIEARLGGTQL
ncbi:MAG: hypothetical protein JF886_03035 [Candidatus Dormibacteraeota bacterium]|uniref:Uncharacterized protein n=1 Tax=Candidatus Aeolococcus gillhamiae TaxID=3127015 RepID=A0A934K1D8_9BACT|nr:hypothetical protein [Candidatus Dormibacteraeota bacterium]